MRRRPVSVGISFLLFAALACSVGVNQGDVFSITQVATLETVSTSTAASTVVAQDPNCTNRLEFVTDVTVPDGTVYKPKAPFTKTCRIKNTGTCAWTTAYSLVFTFGEQMSAPDKIPFTEPIAPGEITDFSVNMTAPSAPGQYRGEWKLMNEKGVLFGFGREYAEPIFVMITVEDSAVANAGGQTGENGNKAKGGNPPAAGCGPQNPCACIPAEVSALNGDADGFIKKHQDSVPKGGFMMGDQDGPLQEGFTDFEDIYNTLKENGLDVQVTASYIDQNGNTQTYTSALVCEPRTGPEFGPGFMLCKTADPFPAAVNFPDPNQSQQISLEIVTGGGDVCWQVTERVLNLCAYDPNADPVCAGGMGGGPGGLVTVTPTLPGYQCSAGYHWCGEGTACCPNGMQCTYIKGNLYCK